MKTLKIPREYAEYKGGRIERRICESCEVADTLTAREQPRNKQEEAAEETVVNERSFSAP